MLSHPVKKSAQVWSCRVRAQGSGRGDDDLVFGTGEETGELGIAEESVLRTIPAHRLRALEKQQTDATLSNSATRVRHRRGLPLRRSRSVHASARLHFTM